jgi:uncharacterized protein (TIGR00297 family)
VSAPLALLATRRGRLSAPAAVAGLVCAAIIYAAFYLAGLSVLGTALALTVAASRIGATRRQPDPEDARRGAASIFANCGVGTLAAIAEIANLGIRTETTALWCVTAIAAGASDTVASEIGKAFGGAPRSFPTWQRTQPGTPGAVTIAGTGAGVVAALLIGMPAAAFWLLPWTSLWIVVIGCTVGAFVESALATTFERDGRWANHVLNGINTTVAAATAGMMSTYGRP